MPGAASLIGIVPILPTVGLSSLITTITTRFGHLSRMRTMGPDVEMRDAGFAECTVFLRDESVNKDIDITSSY
jgi:hypothetical protein